MTKATQPSPLIGRPPKNPGLRFLVLAFFVQAEDDDYLSIRDGAIKWSVTDQAVRNAFQPMVQSGQLETFRIGSAKTLGYRRGPALKGKST